jgi:hypothetical protein
VTGTDHQDAARSKAGEVGILLPPVGQSAHGEALDSGHRQQAPSEATFEAALCVVRSPSDEHGRASVELRLTRSFREVKMLSKGCFKCRQALNWRGGRGGPFGRRLDPQV